MSAMPHTRAVNEQWPRSGVCVLPTLRIVSADLDDEPGPDARVSVRLALANEREVAGAVVRVEPLDRERGLSTFDENDCAEAIRRAMEMI